MTQTAVNNRQQFLEAAWSIGCTLLKDAIWHNGACTWQGYAMEYVEGRFQAVMRTFGAELYSGTAGMALFLDSLYTETQDKLVKQTLEGAIMQARSTMQQMPDYGYYAGKPGVAATLLRTGVSQQREDWIEEGLQLLESIPAESIGAHQVDVISGAAGTIPVLLAAYNLYQRQSLLDKATVLGNLLCRHADKEEAVWSWNTMAAKSNLTGYSHGASGVALALLLLYEETRNPLFLEAAQGGFAYERKAFDAVQQNWPDYRDGVQGPIPGRYGCGLAWCHGAPGIALARAVAMRIMPDAALQVDKQLALATTAADVYKNLLNDLSSNFSLCHGIAGNADVLLEAGDATHHSIAEAVGVAGFHKYHAQGKMWPGGVNTGELTPGLMMGLAGTGHFYLRLLNPAKHKTLLLPGI